ncbi:14-3-3 domain-containing protein, partial [Cynara cardunculus var. scolymus]
MEHEKNKSDSIELSKRRICSSITGVAQSITIIFLFIDHQCRLYESQFVVSWGNEDHVSVIKNYRSKIEKELSDIGDGILKMLDKKLVPSASSGDSNVFYLKMKGDYHRYLPEFKTGGERKEAAESTLNAYKAAQ